MLQELDRYPCSPARRVAVGRKRRVMETDSARSSRLAWTAGSTEGPVEASAGIGENGKKCQMALFPLPPHRKILQVFLTLPSSPPLPMFVHFYPGPFLGVLSHFYHHPQVPAANSTRLDYSSTLLKVFLVPTQNQLPDVTSRSGTTFIWLCCPKMHSVISY